MSHQSVVRVLLSLVLLLSQQMAILHGISHWTDERGRITHARSVDQKKNPKSPTAGQNCEQCLAFSQIGAALGTARFAFYAPGHTAPAPRAILDLPDCRRTVCVFQSRAPPLA